MKPYCQKLPLVFASFAAFILCLQHVGAVKGTVEEDLINNLTNHNILVRPVTFTNETVTVNMGMSLIKILDIDEAANIIRASVWLRFSWNAKNLAWDPSIYDVDLVRIPIMKLWRPDIVLYNGVGTEKHWDEGEHKNAVITRDGTVVYIPFATITAQCNLNYRLYPYDEQTCTFKFGSWTHDGFKLDLAFFSDLAAIDTNDYIGDSAWVLMKTNGVKNTKYYPCCKEPYPDITFSLTVLRKSTYLVVVYIYPVVIVAFVSPFIFLIPHQIPGKVLFGLLVLLIEVIQLMMLNSALPGHRVNTPIVVWVYLYNMAMTTVSLFLTLVTTNLSASGFCGRPVPNFIRKCLLDNAIGRLCGVSETSMNYDGFENPLHMTSTTEDGSKNGANTGVERANTAVTSNVGDWKRVALTLDRYFFVIMLVMSVVITLGMLNQYQI
ncbi:unnamed protein product [Owenia fusiformis]|uniref:Neurotransmitter-gated ion-channel ligand-binding domain-containing protein n=1 Tax=Owenia fusiformis TaxID=6347 RepID=A0A8S4PDX2_OWEFU|nr:unnamed protein product [Owenia fusiformis]